MEITCFEYSLSDFIDKNNKENYYFSVPLYQRLYNWESQHIKQLLDDILAACSKDESYYFIGNVVISLGDKCVNEYQLIDGQQRMTTLWLIALVLAKHEMGISIDLSSKFSQVCICKEKLRLTFPIRNIENDYLRFLHDVKNLDDIYLKPTSNEEVNVLLISAIKEIRQYFLKADNIEALAIYILNNVRVIATVLPEGIDLNKYFEAMNNRGFQLEKHEILKARLLSSLEDKYKFNAATVWDACSQMDHYVEKSLPGLEKELVEPLSSVKAGVLAAAFLSKNHDGNLSTARLKIIDFCQPKPANLTDQERQEIKEKIGIENEKLTEERFRSIVRFPIFLLHVLKLFAAFNQIEILKKIRIEDSRLLESYESLLELMDRDSEKKLALDFFEFLLKTRILFDENIIRFHMQSDEPPRHEIARIKTIKSQIADPWDRYVRSIDKGDPCYAQLAMVQGMLNASTQSEHWLTPFLAWILGQSYCKTDTHLTHWLEGLDTHLAAARLANLRLIDCADELISRPSQDEWCGQKFVVLDASSLKRELNRGTSTERYWFFRLDYFLWKGRSKFFEGISKEFSRFVDNFQFRQNRSVEHISPQNPDENEYHLDIDDLNGFGNLALISAESNSSFGNKHPAIKCGFFKARAKEFCYFESLKLAYFYELKIDDWNWDPSKPMQHGKDCAALLQYCN